MNKSDEALKANRRIQDDLEAVRLWWLQEAADAAGAHLFWDFEDEEWLVRQVDPDEHSSLFYVLPQQAHGKTRADALIAWDKARKEAAP